MKNGLRRARIGLPVGIVVAWTLFPALLAHAATADVPVRVKALNDLLAEQWEWTLKDQPEFATTIGDYRYNDQVSDLSLAHVQEQKRAMEDFLRHSHCSAS